MMRILELFAGYGSQALALENLGIEFTSDISEIDMFLGGTDTKGQLELFGKAS